MDCLHPNISKHNLHTVLQEADKENLFNNQELLWLVIISSVLMTFVFDSGVI